MALPCAPTHWTPLHTVHTKMLKLGSAYWGPCAYQESQPSEIEVHGVWRADHGP